MEISESHSEQVKGYILPQYWVSRSGLDLLEINMRGILIKDPSFKVLV